MTIIECLWCGAAAPSPRGSRKWCSRKCKSAAGWRRRRGEPQPGGGWGEGHQRKHDAWVRDRKGLIRDGLDFGLSREAIANDCGVKVLSLERWMLRCADRDSEIAELYRRYTARKGEYDFSQRSRDHGGHYLGEAA